MIAVDRDEEEGESVYSKIRNCNRQKIGVHGAN